MSLSWIFLDYFLVLIFLCIFPCLLLVSLVSYFLYDFKLIVVPVFVTCIMVSSFFLYLLCIYVTLRLLRY